MTGDPHAPYIAQPDSAASEIPRCRNRGCWSGCAGWDENGAGAPFWGGHLSEQQPLFRRLFLFLLPLLSTFLADDVEQYVEAEQVVDRFRWRDRQSCAG
jgi:hypothetical protein